MMDSHFVYAIDHQNLIRHLLFSGNVSALWSIPPEVQFYVLFLGIWLALWSLKSRGNAAILVVALAVVFALISQRAALPGTFVGSKIHYFFTGVVFGLLRIKVVASVGLKSLGYLQACALLLIGLIVADSVHMDLGSKRELYLNLVPALFAGVFIFLFSFDTGLSKRIFGNRLISMCGECSFSMYLINIPVIYVAVMLLGKDVRPAPVLAVPVTAVILVAAWAMYRLVEMPGNTLLRTLGTRLLLGKQSIQTPTVVATPQAEDAQSASSASTRV